LVLGLGSGLALDRLALRLGEHARRGRPGAQPCPEPCMPTQPRMARLELGLGLGLGLGSGLGLGLGLGLGGGVGVGGGGGVG
jgi:hypothetical protein